MMKSPSMLMGLALILAGCAAPRDVRWNENAGVIGPERTGSGYLSVEMVDPLVVISHVPRMRSVPFLLYDADGRYLTQYNYPYLPPVALRPGRYVVVVRVEGEERPIQVLLAEGRLTRVNLNRLDADRRIPEGPIGLGSEPHR